MNTHITRPLILQFGTSRFLQAHVDYFVSKSLSDKRTDTSILVVQSSDSAAGKSRVTAMNKHASYPIKIQGISDGLIIDTVEEVNSIVGALQADKDWDKIVTQFCHNVSHVVSNTADQGFQLDVHDSILSHPPKSYPAKLLVLLFARYEFSHIPVTMMPCELIANNGAVLKSIVIDLAKQWKMDYEFIIWMEEACFWVNSLVDRIVSESIQPLGAVAEPYALWAIENQEGLRLPCEHEAIRLVSDLAPLEWLKLSLLNLSHTYLVDVWLQIENSDITLVSEAMKDEFLRNSLETLLACEVVPILKAMPFDEDIDQYLASVRDRFLNPFLKHKLCDIAENHEIKVARRVLPLYQEAMTLNLNLSLKGITACLSRHGLL